MKYRIRKISRPEHLDQKKDQSNFYWASVAAFLVGAVFWLYLLFDCGKGLWLRTPKCHHIFGHSMFTNYLQE